MQYEEEKRCVEKGYVFLGWQVHIGNSNEIKNCFDLGHFNNNGVVKSKQHTPSGSNVTYWCDECKHYWKIDMSG